MRTETYKVSEIFTSIQGEGIHSQIPMTFLRLHGCNLECPWCDTQYANKGVFTEYLLPELLQELEKEKRKFNLEWLYITGGEPLLQIDTLLVKSIRRHLFNKIVIATNGTLRVPPWYKTVRWDIDCKCPSASPKLPFNTDWLIVGKHNAIKFIISSQSDLSYISTILPFIRAYPNHPIILLSPVITTEPTSELVWPKEVWNFCTSNNLGFSYQLHKVVWGLKKGV